MAWLCPECGSESKLRTINYYNRHSIHNRMCSEHPVAHRFKTVEFYVDDVPNIEEFLVDHEIDSKTCPFCRHGEQNQLLNSETSEDTDIEVFVGRLGDVLRVKHYDIEGDAYDTREIVHINFCPMCGRCLKK